MCRLRLLLLLLLLLLFDLSPRRRTGNYENAKLITYTSRPPLMGIFAHAAHRYTAHKYNITTRLYDYIYYIVVYIENSIFMFSMYIIYKCVRVCDSKADKTICFNALNLFLR